MLQLLNRPLLLLYLFAVSLWMPACQQAQKASKSPESKVVESTGTDMVIEVEDYVEASEGVSKSGGGLLFEPDTKSWTSYELNVTQAGRYKVELMASEVTEGTASFWIEDYIDNKDGRTYNITGALVAVEGLGEKVLTKDGSPLNIGTHKIKLHKEGASAKVDAIKISLIRPHTDTPKNLTQNMEGDEWDLVWSDEFEGSGLLDESKWTYDVGDWGWGNNELQYYTVAREKNARRENGNLIIQSHKNDEGHAWTSARLTTRGKVSFTYGKIEFKAKVPPNRGNWAAGWTLGDDYRDEISWPYCGEIDIMESVGFEMDDETGDGEAHCTIHCRAYYFKIGNQPTGIIPVKRMYQDFHTYAVIWTPESITGYVDDKAYFTYEKTDVEHAWPFDKPQNIILNLAMGGGWGGAQGMDETMQSQELIIDYVRVYGKK